MPKATTVPTLNLNNSRNVPQSPNIGTLSARSTDSPHSPRSPPLSPAYIGEDPIRVMQTRQENGATSPRMGTLPDPPLSPGRTSPKQHSRDASRSFFSNLMASKSSHKLQAQSPDASAPETTEKQGRSRGNSKDRSLYSVKRQTSTPDLPRLMTSNGIPEDETEQPPPVSADSTVSKQKSKSKLGGILTRSRSGRPEEEKKHKPRPPTQLNLEVHPPPDTNDQYAAPPKTAPVKTNHRDHLYAAEGATTRNRSADRMGHEDSRINGHHFPTNSNGPPSSHREGASLFANIQQTGRGMSDRLGKAGRGFFSKMTRSGSTNERELVPDENYVCTTINLPLVKQTRKTRIAKKLELSKDKTEYWMPALPWRCIDYLNMQCEQEGLYRVPGSGRDVKFWQRRFDTEHDINLFEEPELYDVNTIASMFKAWLRDLPDELFPKATQIKISSECAGAQRTPQLLKDELSRLPPFNYYLLFAITCHLSLLHSYADQNKMDYRNLCICFQPCLRIDAFCFQFLVIDWKECWQQGCYTEKEYLEEERRYERDGSISTTATTEAESSLSQNTAADERAVSSSNSSANMGMNGVNGNMQPNAAAQTRPPRSADGGYSRPLTSSSQLKPKQRSLSSSGNERTRSANHGHAATAPAVPRLVSKTPEQKPSADSKLPELGSMSPIRM
ncbi:hypothetical protein H2198_005930 [Neophaeococcomyces mojaviensis]|uniref:Uncharacterized protein n=1 Tax=Neophaeococcomyces mojaviensis TaxID=3383035 RepID=A0ACC3A4S7_9EURO|nr:hypothetical protein H2198_005930 [Knufia sp. JES_112]